MIVVALFKKRFLETHVLKCSHDLRNGKLLWHIRKQHFLFIEDEF